jgi:hypothetical protein
MLPNTYVEHTSDRSVEFIENIAIVQGLNMVRERKTLVASLCYADVYEWAGGRWQAIFSQETPIQAKPRSSQRRS